MFTIVNFILFTLLHLALIPLLAFFGINTCPLLEEHGFQYSCQTMAPVAVSVLIIQTLILYTIRVAIKKWPKILLRKPLLVQLLPIIFLGSHFLNFYLNVSIFEDHLTEITPSTPAIVLFLWTCSSVILILSWQWVETELLFLTRSQVIKESKSDQNLFFLWLIDQKNKIVPVIGLILFFSSYFELVFVSQNSWENPNMILAEEKDKFISIAALVIVWQMLIYYFDFCRNLVLAKEVAAHLHNIESQNFKYRSNTLNSGFFSVMFSLLNRLSDTLMKKSRLLKGFSSFVSDSVSHDVLFTQDHAYSGDSKKVAIMMADIRDFTSLSSQMKPQDVVDLLNIYFSDMIEVFVENGIVVDKFIGDGVLAYAVEEGSSPVYDNMLKTAFDMHLKLVQTNIKLKNKKLPKIQLGIGLHEGTVILGSIGSKDKRQYTIIGNPVNITTRLESLCKPLKVGLIVSAPFLAKVNPKHHSKFTNLGGHKLRGIDLPMEVHGAIAYETKKYSSAA